MTVCPVSAAVARISPASNGGSESNRSGTSAHADVCVVAYAASTQWSPKAKASKHIDAGCWLVPWSCRKLIGRDDSTVMRLLTLDILAGRADYQAQRSRSEAPSIAVFLVQDILAAA